MKYKIAVCKTHMIGSPALILGICRYDEGDAFWQKFQFFTAEECLESNEGSLKQFAIGRSKYHKGNICFDSINKSVEIFHDTHDFNFERAKPLEVTKSELELLSKELNRDGWEDFDWETWGK